MMVQKQYDGNVYAGTGQEPDKPYQGMNRRQFITRVGVGTVGCWGIFNSGILYKGLESIANAADAKPGVRLAQSDAEAAKIPGDYKRQDPPDSLVQVLDSLDLNHVLDLGKKEKDKEIIEYLNPLTKVDPVPYKDNLNNDQIDKFRELYNELGVSLFFLKRFSESKQFLQIAYEIDGKDPEVTKNLGTAYAELGQYDAAEQLLNLAVKQGYEKKKQVDGWLNWIKKQRKS